MVPCGVECIRLRSEMELYQTGEKKDFLVMSRETRRGVMPSADGHLTRPNRHHHPFQLQFFCCPVGFGQLLRLEDAANHRWFSSPSAANDCAHAAKQS